MKVQVECARISYKDSKGKSQKAYAGDIIDATGLAKDFQWLIEQGLVVKIKDVKKESNDG